jgi:hypothetical protein
MANLHHMKRLLETWECDTFPEWLDFHTTLPPHKWEAACNLIVAQSLCAPIDTFEEFYGFVSGVVEALNYRENE